FRGFGARSGLEAGLEVRVPLHDVERAKSDPVGFLKRSAAQLPGEARYRVSVTTEEIRLHDGREKELTVETTGRDAALRFFAEARQGDWQRGLAAAARGTEVELSEKTFTLRETGIDGRVDVHHWGIDTGFGISRKRFTGEQVTARGTAEEVFGL